MVEVSWKTHLRVHEHLESEEFQQEETKQTGILNNQGPKLQIKISHIREFIINDRKDPGPVMKFYPHHLRFLCYF